MDRAHRTKVHLQVYVGNQLQKDFACGFPSANPYIKGTKWPEDVTCSCCKRTRYFTYISERVLQHRKLYPHGCPNAEECRACLHYKQKQESL